MVNPYSPGDKVLIQRKGIEIEATVRATWNHEIQVRVADGELLWRTVKTVRSYPVPGGPTGEEPLIMSDEPHELYPTQVIKTGEAPVESAAEEPELALPVEHSEVPAVVEQSEPEVPQEEAAAAPDTESEQPGKRHRKSKKERKGLLRRILPKGPFLY